MSTFSKRCCRAGLLGLVALVFAAGCGGGTKKVTISGTVTYKNQPLSGGMLKFDGPKGPTAALIQKDGKFIMTDIEPGEVKVSLSGTPQSSGRPGDAPSAPKVTPDDLPEKYRDPEKSGLKYTITPDTRELDIKID